MAEKVTLAIRAESAENAAQIAAGLSGFTPDPHVTVALVQDDIYGVVGTVSGDVQDDRVIGFVVPEKPKLGIMAYKLEAILCDHCKTTNPFGGCLRHGCKNPNCKQGRFAGIDLSLQICRQCAQPDTCQRCGKKVTPPAQ